MSVKKKPQGKTYESGKFNNYAEAYNSSTESPHLRGPAVLLDVPYLEDIYIQDLTNPVANYSKRGYRPTWSRYTRFTEVNETRPAVQAEANKLADEEWQDDENDYRDPGAFLPYYK